jgi:hypothetical protein
MRRNASRPMTLAAVLLVLFGAQASHAAVDCTGLITNLSLQLSAEGTVTLSLAGGPSYTYLCDTAGVGINGVNPSVCRAMYASLLVTKTSGKRVLIRFNDYSSCAAVPAWANAGSLGWTQLALE